MTLLELLEKYNVVIPLIQRDYAQGREDPQTKNVRENLLNDMKKAILKRTSQPDLNYVYGKVNNNEEFIPIDGQQRLTTLFLLHLYAFRNDSSKTDLLKKFTYETRISSRDFLKEIIEKRGEIFKTNQNYPHPSDIITDSSDFLLSYKYDPTVQSVLVMLDAIADIFKDVNDLADKLQDKEPPIVFSFLNIEDLGSADNLYIKLNARGKALTDFENFKAKLLDRLRDLSKANNPPSDTNNFANNFELMFDMEWTDLFWRRKRVNYEEEFRTLFKILLFNYGKIEKFENDEAKHDTWLHTLKYKEIPADFFVSAYNLLNYLCGNYDKNSGKPTEPVAEMIFEVLENVTAQGCVKFHSISMFLLKQKVSSDSQPINDWVRVFRNLVNNSNIDRYEKAHLLVNSINIFSEKPAHLTNVLSNIGSFDADIGGLEGLKEQFEEEKTKAAIILAERQKVGSAGVTGSFETEIKNAEAFPFFEGQIRAGLYLSEDTSKPY